MKISHIINPYETRSFEDKFIQNVSLASIEKALEGQHDVEVVTRIVRNEKLDLPSFISSSIPLNRTIGEVDPNLSGRALPLISDIIQESVNEIQSEYVIYTNSDIALMPYFYQEVKRQLEGGHDALVINRRRISDTYSSLSELPAMYADIGYSHPGFDCFVFKRELIDRFELAHICVGVPFSGVSLLHNVLAFSKKPKIIMDQHLTFHIGTDVLNFKKDAYYWHNRNEYFKKVKPKLKPYLELEKFPYANLPRFKRSIKWMLNPSLATRDLLNFEWKGLKENFKNLRWQILQS